MNPSSPGRSLWSEVRAVVAGESRDYTSGSIARGVVLLAIPMVAEMAMQSIFAVVDVFFVAKLGAEAVAAAGMTDYMLTLVFSIAMGLSMAATAMIARRIGEGRPGEAAVAAVQAMGLGVLVSIPLGVLGVVFASDLLRLMGASNDIVEAGRGFTAIMLGTNITVMLLFLVNAIFRGAGDAIVALRALWIANIVNIALDPLFIFGWGPVPAMGIEGAAIATATGRGVGVLFQLRALAKGRGRIRLERRHLAVDLAVARRLVRIAGVGMVQFLIGTASWIGIIRILALFGDAVLAGYTIAVRVIIFALLPSWGMGNAAATLVGQNLGAGRPERAERSVWIASFSNMIFLGLVGLAFRAHAESVVGIFSREPDVVAAGSACLAIVAHSYPFLAFGLVMVQAFNGAGDTTTPTWINFFCYWLVQIPVAFLLSSVAGYGPPGVFGSIAAAQITLAVVGIALFRRGSWKLRTV